MAVLQLLGRIRYSRWRPRNLNFWFSLLTL